jgi:hypothetical protein
MNTTSLLRPSVNLRRGADRRQTRIGWLHGRHSFDTGVDPLGADTHHGVLVVSNHDTIADLQGRLAVVASGMTRYRDQAAIRIRNRYAALHVARLGPGESVAVPDAPFVHVYVSRGQLDLEAQGSLDAGDAARLTAAGERRLGAVEPSEVLIWEMHASLSPAASI